MPCQGFAADIYDLYVLGLLEGKERGELERQLAQNCPTCLQGVRRSLDLWLVFASTLDETEPSADFRSRMVRIADLSKKVLTFPRNDVDQHRLSFRWWLAGGAVVAATLLAGAYFAGVQSGSVKTQQLNAQVYRLTQDLASSQVQLDSAAAKQRASDEALKKRGVTAAILGRDEQARRRTLELEAEVGQYRAALERQQSMVADNSTVLKAMLSPGLRFIPLKGEEAAEKSVAYALVVEASKIVVVAAKLPRLPDDRQFQLWLIRKQEPKTAVNCGVFSADDENRAIFAFENPVAVADLAALAVTEEPKGGSSSPTTDKLLVGSAPPEKVE